MANIENFEKKYYNYYQNTINNIVNSNTNNPNPINKNIYSSVYLNQWKEKLKDDSETTKNRESKENKNNLESEIFTNEKNIDTEKNLGNSSFRQLISNYKESYKKYNPNKTNISNKNEILEDNNEYPDKLEMIKAIRKNMFPYTDKISNSYNTNNNNNENFNSNNKKHNDDYIYSQFFTNNENITSKPSVKNKSQNKSKIIADIFDLEEEKYEGSFSKDKLNSRKEIRDKKVNIDRSFYSEKNKKANLNKSINSSKSGKSDNLKHKNVEKSFISEKSHSIDKKNKKKYENSIIEISPIKHVYDDKLDNSHQNEKNSSFIKPMKKKEETKKNLFNLSVIDQLQNSKLNRNKNNKNKELMTKQNGNYNKAVLETSNNENSSSEAKSIKIYINNSELNKKKYKTNNNFIRTSKYTWYDFLPLSILYQFKRIANVYFLLIAIIQSISILSPLNPITAIAPFLIVLFVSVLREGLEDYTRHKSDQKENSTPSVRWNNSLSNWEIVESQLLEIGDIVKIVENQVIPADLLILCCSNLTKIAYIETATLDGEKNNKPRQCITQIFDSLKSINECVRLRGTIICNTPNCELTKFNGCINLNKHHNYSFNNKQLLYKGTFLRNTEWAVGIVCYAGKDTKIVLNSMKSNNKQSHLEGIVNTIIVTIFFIQIALCILLAGVIAYWTRNNKNPEIKENNKHFYLENDVSPTNFGIISFFSYILLLNTFIPISLIVSLEMVKYAQGYFMSVDCKMYSNFKNRFAQTNTVSLNEELGQIKYIFSDKTGTLTANQLKFKACVIGNNTFISAKDSDFDFTSLKKISTKYSENKKFNIKIASEDNQAFSLISNDNDVAHHYFYCLSLNHLMRVDLKKKDSSSSKILDKKMTRHDFIEKIHQESQSNIKVDNNPLKEFEIKYKGENPDEQILVETAKEAGFVYLGGNESEAFLYTFKDKSQLKNNNELNNDNSSNNLHNEFMGTVHNLHHNQKWKILKILEFSSARGMMSVIVQNENGNIYLYTKGGDKKLKSLLGSYQPYIDYVSKEALKLSESGLRVLWIAFKPLSEQEFEEWKVKYDRGLTKLVEEKEIDEYNKIHYKEIEEGICIIGCTAVEDKLQENVPETLKTLQSAGINTWVLTGDTLPTAKNIGIMCNLITKNMDIYELLDNEEIFKSKIDPDGVIFNKNSLSMASKTIIEFESLLPTDYPNINEKLAKKSFLLVGLKRLLELYNKVNYTNYDKCYDDKEDKSKEGLTILDKQKQKVENLKGVLVESDIIASVLPPVESLNLSLYCHPLTKAFLELTLNSNAVICCRVAPQQKALIVRMIKNNIQNAITLSVGDGANDVAMILEADVGVGIYGEEGTQAAMSADYAIGEFQNMNRLILVHGRLNYIRISEMILYFFYKNFLFTLPQLIYAFYNWSGQTLYDEWYVSLYNLMFTTLPLLIKAVFEKDITDDDSEICQKAIPYVYYLGRESKIFSIKTFFNTVIISLIKAITIFYIISHVMEGIVPLSSNGYVPDMWANSITQFTCIIFVVNNRIVFSQRFHSILSSLTLVLTSYLLYISYFVFSSYFEYSKSQGTMHELVKFPHFYLLIFLIFSLSFLFELAMLAYEIFFVSEPPNLLRTYIQVSIKINLRVK